jgi:hypothetical protein
VSCKFDLSALAAAVRASGAEVLICLEHQHIPANAQAIPFLDATTIPSAWPGDRFFEDPAAYTFGSPRTCRCR